MTTKDQILDIFNRYSKVYDDKLTAIADWNFDKVADDLIDYVIKHRVDPEIMPTVVEVYEAEKELCKWIPISIDPKEDGEYILYRPESESQHFAYFWCGTDIHGTHGWVGEGNIPLPVEEYSHYYKPLHAPMI